MDQVLLHPCGKTFGFCAKVQCDRNSINSGESHHLIRFVIIVVFIVLYKEGGLLFSGSRQVPSLRWLARWENKGWGVAPAQ